MTCATLLRDPYFAPLFAHVWPLFWPYLILQLRPIARAFCRGEALSIHVRVTRWGHITWRRVVRPLPPPDWRARLLARVPAPWPWELAAAPFDLPADKIPDRRARPVFAAPCWRPGLAWPDTS